MQQLNCLNEDAPSHTLRSILNAKQLNVKSDAYLLSDVDEQLILNIPVRAAISSYHSNVLTHETVQPDGTRACDRADEQGFCRAAATTREALREPPYARL